jgi:hypothetical protein
VTHSGVELNHGMRVAEGSEEIEDTEDTGSGRE